MILNSKIFRAYDIRGEAFTDFDEDGFFVIAHAFCKYIAKKHGLKNPNIFVSGDARLSMPELYPAVITGLKSAGANVTWGGAIPTPVNYFAFHEGGFDASIQISASHNPADDNGLKLLDKNGAVCGDEIQEIRKIAECTECQKSKDYGVECESVDFSLHYEQKLKEITPSQDPLKVIIDCGNAISGMFYPNIFQKFGHEVRELFCDLDTSFPNHQPDPERSENLGQLIEEVQTEAADFGFAFDGDGDRVGVILKEGTILSADKILFILVSDFLVRNPKSPIVIDAMSSATLADKIRKKGGDPIFSKTGHSHIEHKMVEVGAKLAGEQSGHFMFGEDFYGHDDAMLASLRFIRAVEDNHSLLEEVTSGWPNLIEFSEKFTAPDETKFQILEKYTEELLKQFPDASTLDGIRIDFGDGEWAIVRCSNTSPKIAIRIEAKDQKSLDTKKELLVGALEKLL
jgi:phosphomannomutase / phosphoglucomutase